jgi:predicted permease
MHSVLRDLRYSLRQLAKSPGFTLTAVLSLALGIGATTAVFSVVYAALLNPYPYPTADRIVRIRLYPKNGLDQGAGLNGPQILRLRQSPIVEDMLAMDYHSMILTGHDVPEDVAVLTINSNGFDDLGVPPLLGRGLLPSDAPDGQDPQPVAVLSYKFWQRHFSSDPSAVGKTLQLDHKNYQIVGVAAPRFTWRSADVYLPLKLTQDPEVIYIANPLLRQGVNFQAAGAALQPLLDQFARDTPKHFPEHFRVKVEGLNQWVVKQGTSGMLYLLLGAVALLLAIGCANVSILLLARGAARQHELAVRAALGASRRRIVRQLLTESLLLAAIGAAFGVLTSYGMLAGIRTVLPKYAFAPEVVIRINLPVLFFSVVVALGTGILFGLWPALRLSRTRLGQMMQSSSRRLAGSLHARKTHSVLIAGQIALTLLLLAGAGSAMEGFVRMMHLPLGYDPHHVLDVGIPLHDNSYTTWAARAAYFEQLRAKLAEMPSVTMAAISENATPPQSGWDLKFEIMGRPSAEDRMGSVNAVSPEFFAILRIPLLQGRLWNAAENLAGAHLAVINRTLADRFFPNGDAIGHSVMLPRLVGRPPDELSAPNAAASWLQIVGIVGDVRNDGLRNAIKPAIYIPYPIDMWKGTQILVRSNVPPLSLLHAIQLQLVAVNPDQQTFSTATYTDEDLDSWISDQPEWQQEHLAAWVFGVLAWLALTLAAVGLYSVVSYTVAQRTNEFGIRVALGAQRGHLIRIVFASTLASVGTGILAGLALTLAMNKILAKWAVVNSRDPLLLLAEALLLTLVSAIACAIPARRASTLDPMTALRCE